MALFSEDRRIINRILRLKHIWECHEANIIDELDMKDELLEEIIVLKQLVDNIKEGE